MTIATLPVFAPPDTTPKGRHSLCLAALALVAACVLTACGQGAQAGAGASAASGGSAAASAAAAALTVSITQAQSQSIARSVRATGNLSAWQEASVGVEGQGLRLARLHAQVGDAVRAGQVLATFTSDVPRADLAQAQAAVAEAKAMAANASADAARARELEATGALSAQQIAQFKTAEQTALARARAAQAAAQAAQVRLSQTQVRAPDAGIVSARSATLGAVVGPGVELFRLIRQGRLEWRAEVAAADIAHIKPGQRAQIEVAPDQTIIGVVRSVAPTIDAASRNGMVYVDVSERLTATPGPLKAGQFAQGRIEVGSSQALTLPQTAVLLRDGFSQVFVVDAQQRVRNVRVHTGRLAGDRVEITSGLPAGARVVASGAGFLSDGDTVRVVASATAANAGTRSGSKP